MTEITICLNRCCHNNWPAGTCNCKVVHIDETGRCVDFMNQKKEPE